MAISVDSYDASTYLDNSLFFTFIFISFHFILILIFIVFIDIIRLRVSYSTFTSNGVSLGGAIQANVSSLYIIGCYFIENEGGAIFTTAQTVSPLFSACFFYILSLVLYSKLILSRTKGLN